MIQLKIIEFLKNRNWNQISENEKFLILKPPLEHNFPQEFTLSIPKNSQTIDFKRFINNILDILTDIYEINKDDLEIILEKEHTIFSIKIADDFESVGSIPFIKFDDMINKIKDILLNTASFVIDKQIKFIRITGEALKYLNLCNFLQTEKGSFIAKIQLPNNEKIKESELYDDDILSKDINNRIHEILKFVNSEIFPKEVDHIDDEYIAKNQDKINIKLLEDIEEFYDKTNIENINFGFININTTEKIESEKITKDKKQNLSNFIEILNDKLFKDEIISLRGIIISLKSKNPDGTRNNIRIAGISDLNKIIASANLRSQDYKNAIEAHKNKKYVTITGLIKKEKTQYKFLSVDNFIVG